MGTFRPGRSDIDFVAVVDGELNGAELTRIRALHMGRWTSALIHDVGLRRRWPLVCNGIYLRRDDLAKSPLEVTPLAAHVAGRFRIATREGFDVNPVTWHVLAHHGIAIRGPDRDRLQIHADDAELRAWTLGNLNGYWRLWVGRARRAGLKAAAALPRWFATSGVLGVPRLHYTLTSGRVASKEDAALYALEAFEPRWRPLIEDALAYRSGEPAPGPYRRHPTRRRADAADFVAHVIDAGNALVRDTPSASET